MKKISTFILLAFAIGMMTSCSLDDEQTTDYEQVSATDNTEPTPEHEGDDEELEVND